MNTAPTDPHDALRLDAATARAVDLLFEGGGRAASADAARHTKGVARVLGLLDLLVIDEPPAGLVERTLRRVDEADLPAGALARPAPHLGGTVGRGIANTPDAPEGS